MEKQIEKAVRQVDFNLVSKWRVKLTQPMIQKNIKNVIETSRNKNDLRVYFILFDLFDDIVPFIPEFFIQLCQDENNAPSIVKYIEDERFPDNFLIDHISKVPPAIYTIFIQSFTTDELNVCLKHVFELSWNTDRYIDLLERLLEAGADPNFYDEHCGTTPFEMATSLAQAAIFLKHGQTVNKKRVLDQAIYNLIWELSVDIRHVYNDNTRIRFEDRTEFVLSRVTYEYICNDGNICDAIDNSDDFELTIKFFEENGIKFKRYKGWFGKKINDMLFNLGINVDECEFESELIKFSYVFPKQDEYDVETDKICPNKVNYYCWFDHLPESLELAIGKYNMIK